MPSAVSKARSRPNRVSSPAARNGTPAASTSTPAAAVSKEWTEPAIEEGKPSWEEHGGAPYGVLEDMQALGQPPNAKVKARVKDVSLRKSLGKNAGITQEAIDTPEGTPARETAGSEVVAQEPPSQEPLPVIPDDEKDVDYQPRAVKNLKSTRTRLSRSAAASSEPPKPKSSPAPAQPEVKPSKTPSAEPAHRSPSITMPDPPKPPEREHKIKGMHKIVSAAVERSKQVGNAELGFAINQVFIWSFDDDRLTYLLKVILEQTATKAEGDQFRAEIQRAKKLLKSHRKVQPETTRKNQAKLGSESKRENVREAAHKSAAQQEAVPRPSIEGSNNVPKIKLSVRAPKREAAEDQSSNTNGRATSAMKREGSQSSTSSLSEAPDSPLSSAGPSPLPESVQQRQSSPQRIVPPVTNTLKRSSAEAGLVADERDNAVAAKKQKFRELSYQEPAPQVQAPESHLRADKPRALRQRTIIDYQIPAATTNNKTPVNRTRRDLSESPLSDLSPPPASPRGTPRNAAHSNAFSKKAKTKQSPEKKQQANGPDADGESGGMGSPAAVDDDDDEAESSSDNNDFCNSCGGPGHLLCCDGCDKSFHLKCLDPPLEEDSPELNEPWFCHICVAKRNPPARQPRGLFAQLLQNLEKRNPSSFMLPEHIRTYFEGVSTGKDGKFVEPPPSKTRSRIGYDEPLDLLKTRDGRGNTILCYQCGKSAAGRREIITCDLCGAHWHLDCTSSPLANPPFRDQYNRKVRDWLCPLHVEHDLREMDPSRIARQRTFYNRRPKNPKIVDTALRRGQINDGIIEIIEDSSSEDDSEFEEDESASGTIYRLPAKGVKLDFIDKVSSERKAKQQARDIAEAQALLAATPTMRRKTFTTRPFTEQKTALSLVQFARQGSNADLGLDGEKIDDLVGALIAEAPDAVVQRLAADEENARPVEKLTRQQREELEMLQELIKRKLGGAGAAG